MMVKDVSNSVNDKYCAYDVVDVCVRDKPLLRVACK
jgi:hypothetical protein